MFIKITNLTKKYDDLVAVDNVSLDIAENQIFALLGLNGAGKTTLIKMLTCLIKPTSGNAVVLGNSILTNSQNIKQLVNISPQETSIAPNLTVKENLIFIAEVYGLNKNQAVLKAEELLGVFGLNEKSKVLAKKLSGGQARRLGIAMAIISKPKILFLDEPTLGLDVLVRKNLWDIINKIKKDTTIILTTHYLDEVTHLADKVAIMSNGQVIANDTVDNITKSANAKNFEDAFIKMSQKESVNE